MHFAAQLEMLPLNITVFSGLDLDVFHVILSALFHASYSAAFLSSPVEKKKQG